MCESDAETINLRELVNAEQWTLFLDVFMQAGNLEIGQKLELFQVFPAGCVDIYRVFQCQEQVIKKRMIIKVFNGISCNMLDQVFDNDRTVRIIFLSLKACHPGQYKKNEDSVPST